MSKDKDSAVQRGINIVRWSIGIIFVVGLFSVESPSALLGGAILGWCFSAVGSFRSPAATSGHAKPLSLDQSGNWPPPSNAISDGVLRFNYIDADGVVTDRRLVTWGPDDKSAHCFTGFDLLRGEQRTFRIDRVESWG